MILISHRGNLNGREINNENNPEYILNSINLNFNVEIDIWVDQNKIFLGHDFPTHEVQIDWLIEYKSKLWIHCKNIEAILYFKNTDFNFFWHEKDTLTITSKGYLWVYPGFQPIKESIAVMPELNNDNLTECIGICSDYILRYQ